MSNPRPIMLKHEARVRIFKFCIYIYITYKLPINLGS
jgi:hypothetical protein